MSKHTPGPWEIDRETGCIYGPDEEPIMVCGEYAFRYGEGTEEALANNYLFWAAPDLLETCKALKSIIDNCEPYSEEAINRAEVAIKKAEGEM